VINHALTELFRHRRIAEQRRILFRDYIFMPTVSVIIPTYNRAPFVEEAIRSVLAQDFKDFELVVVDDGSTDGTRQTLKRYADSLSVLHQENRGVSSARNTGIKHSQGAYIAFLDSDDLWLPGKLSTQVAFFEEHSQALICQTEEIWLRKGVRVNPRKVHKKYSGEIFEHCLSLCRVSPSSAMIRRTLFDEVGLFDEDLPACEDYDLWLRVACRHPIYLIDEPLIIKRGGHPDQLSRQFEGIDRFRIRALTKILESNHLTPHHYHLALKELKRKCRIYGEGCLKRGKKEEGERYLALPLKYNV
jgi:glycosyltransferase involved in cell wall biosynthesis